MPHLLCQRYAHYDDIVHPPPPAIAARCSQASQSQLLQEVDAALRSEYVVRRRMLIERFKVG